MTRAFVFPGQGSQAVGMGRELAEAFEVARHTFEEVDDALNQRLSRLMVEGPEADLTLTENAQPALMAVSVAVMRVLASEGGVDLAKHATFVAGHSLGEYSALCAAGAFSLGDTARLLKLRGQAMQKAVPVGKGAMAALLGAELEQAQSIAADAAQGEVCSVANDNSAGQVVISGSAEAIDRAIVLAAERGLKRSVRLPVSAPFHCSLMQPAADAMAEALSATSPGTLRVPLFANVTAAVVTDPAEVRTLLVEQVTGRIRWRESAIAMKDAGVERFVELGGKVVGPMILRSAGEVEVTSVATMADVEALAKGL